MRDRWSYSFTASRQPDGLVIAGRAYFDRVVSAQLAMGEVCDFTLSEHVEKRTSAQNRMIWGTVYDQLVDGLGDEVGYDRHDKAGKEKLHEGLCLKYGGTVKDPVTGLDVRKFHTSAASKEEFTAYVEWVARFAAEEYGVVIVLPGEAA